MSRLYGVKEIINHFVDFDPDYKSKQMALKEFLWANNRKSYKLTMDFIGTDKKLLQTYIDNSPYRDIIIREAQKLVDEWEQKRLKGIAEHERKSGIVKEGNSVTPKRDVFDFDVTSIRDGIYNEKLIKGKNTIGIPDRFIITTIGAVRYVSIYDFKVMDKIHFDSKFKMKAPVSHLPNTNYIQASLQLTFYAMLFLQKGFAIHEVAIIQIQMNEGHRKETKHVAKLLPEECKLMINHLKQINK